ncbi:hypothetical protein SAMN05443572_103613 [Myxococcus fulvus]|uniref:Uncharacterized protein n=1 Tax=Myxococcus fulvus TaxID=33 RepID=A0A511TFD6_MYXFU|nr:hypothetical protein [Myxococcus fulvus]GEN12881.1 hypothetical protein MFU01_79180 [Myxococcus fulvus]SET87520.1 hypothetical protein SAMN05443572_103613 [Myxococcus fulvus]
MSLPDPDVMALLARVYGTNNTFFDDDGNYCHRVPSTFTKEDHQRLKAAGMVPNTFVQWEHDEVIQKLRKAAKAVDLQRAADAFVASMTSADVAWLAVLPAAVLGRAMPTHKEDPMGGGHCRVCFFEDDSIDATCTAYLNHVQGAMWGASQPTEGVLTLTWALDPKTAEWPKPTPRDVWVFHQVLDLLRRLPPASRYSHARTALHRAKLLSASSAYRCETVLEALAFISILETPEHPGLLTRFTSAVERDQRPTIRVEVPSPLAWWSAKDGLRKENVEKLFGHLERPKKEPAAAPTPPPAKRRKPASAATPAGAKPKSLPGPPTPGSVYAIQFREDLWGAAYCHQVRTDEPSGTVRGRMEFLDLLSPTPPTAEQVVGLKFKDRLNGERWQTWCASLDKTTGIKRIAVDVPAPAHRQPTPDRLPVGGAKDLKHLAGWNFKEV